MIISFFEDRVKGVGDKPILHYIDSVNYHVDSLEEWIKVNRVHKYMVSTTIDIPEETPDGHDILLSEYTMDSTHPQVIIRGVTFNSPVITSAHNSIWVDDKAEHIDDDTILYDYRLFDRTLDEINYYWKNTGKNKIATLEKPHTIAMSDVYIWQVNTIHALRTVCRIRNILTDTLNQDLTILANQIENRFYIMITRATINPSDIKTNFDYFVASIKSIFKNMSNTLYLAIQMSNNEVKDYEKVLSKVFTAADMINLSMDTDDKTEEEIDTIIDKRI